MALPGHGTTATGPNGGRWREWAFHIPVSDGVRLAVDVCLPDGASESSPVSTVMRATRYWRASIDVPEPVAGAAALEREWFTGAGFALMLVDVRGTGASFGVTEFPWTRREIEDLGELVDWTVAQPWSNGRVGAHGISYDANTALMLTTTGRPAVRAAVARFHDWDPYAQITSPGGILNRVFLSGWTEDNEEQDAGRPREGMVAAVKPVDGDDGTMLAAAIEERSTARPPSVNPRNYREDVCTPDGDSLYSLSPVAWQQTIAASGAALFIWAGWQDSATAAGALDAFAALPNPMELYLGPWAHGAIAPGDPFAEAGAAVQPSWEDQHHEMIRFLHDHLDREASARRIRYFCLGNGSDGGWRETTEWPPPGTGTVSWFLGPEGTLTTEPASAGTDVHPVDFEATTGKRSRWVTSLGGTEVVYPDRAHEDERLLTYTTPPLTNEVEVTGTPVLTAFLDSDQTDGSLYAYLEDVAPDGRVTLVTEGQLRLVHGSRTDGLDPAEPFHSFTAADAAALIPGEVDEVKIALIPTSVVFVAGHRIRLALAGHDADNFQRIPADGDVGLTLHRGGTHPSRLDLPVRGG